ncbi:MAG: CinA family nicotinamide mononucleotide deamidase-related protein [Planctomycetales bacterium]|nr:CinA family nicotinamide mononucleotide deamidase-related protein [Planctomycetales bacterium]
MRAEVIAIGDEIITGQRLDTNTQWLAERLVECGVEVAFHSTIGDRLADNVAVFRAAIERADLVVVTGGLGPTADDLTREALAAAVGVPLVRDPASLAFIQALFARRGRDMPERNAVQADFPEGAAPIPNEHGTAPGISLCVDRWGREPCRVFALPGVPAELKPMWHATVRPAVLEATGAARVTRHRLIKCFGVGESTLEAMLPDLIAREREPTVGITVSDATITLRITASGADDAACFAAMEPTAAIIYDKLGTLAFGEADDELEQAVVRELDRNDATLAVAEWATGGLVAEWLTAAGGSRGEQARFAGGVTVATVEQAQRLLDVDPPATQGVDSSAASVALAEAIRARTGATIGLGVAAFPRVTDSPDARLHVAIATADRTRRFRFGCASHPAILRSRAAKQALNSVRLALMGHDELRE